MSSIARRRPGASLTVRSIVVIVLRDPSTLTSPVIQDAVINTIACPPVGLRSRPIILKPELAVQSQS